MASQGKTWNKPNRYVSLFCPVSFRFVFFLACLSVYLPLYLNICRTVQRWFAFDKWKESKISGNQKRKGKQSRQSSAMRESLAYLQTTVLQNSPLTTALQSQTRPLPAFGTFLDPKISTFFVTNFFASPGPGPVYAVCRFDMYYLQNEWPFFISV